MSDNDHIIINNNNTFNNQNNWPRSLQPSFTHLISVASKKICIFANGTSLLVKAISIDLWKLPNTHLNGGSLLV